MKIMKTTNTLTAVQSNCVVVSTKRCGEIMVGCPPEIVKWFLGQGRPIPSIVVLPEHFLIENTLNIEPEFPIYGNFFCQGKKATMIGTKEQLRRVRIIVRESFLGPGDRAEGSGERAFLRATTSDGRPLEVEDLVRFLPFTREGRSVKIDGVTIKALRSGRFEVIEDGVLLGEVDTRAFTVPARPANVFKEKPLDPPTFGVSFVGTGSGFSPYRRTTSFVLWIGGKGVLVDPLMDPWVELNRLGIDPVDVPSVLLTHCHADHDAGMVRAILHHRTTRLITSGVVFQSFLRKARAVVGTDIRGYLDFVETNPGDTLAMGNARIVISSAFHSIPTIRFEVFYTDERLGKDISIAYSGDTCFDPTKIQAMHRQGIIDERRVDELLHFGFRADLLIHEAGRESIHTSAEEIRHFPEEVRKKLILVHTESGSEDVAGLRVAAEGETIELVPSRRSLLERAELIASNPIFENLSMDTLVRIGEHAVSMPFRKGQDIIRQGEEGDRFYVVSLGKVQVIVDDSVRAVLGKGDHFGEISLITGKRRNATIRAISDGSVIALDKRAFLEFLRKQPAVHKRLKTVLKVRPIVSQLTFFQGLSPNQLARLSIRLTTSIRRRGDRVIEQDKKGDAFFVLVSGKAIVVVKDRYGQERIVARLGAGDVFGEIALLRGIPRTATVRIVSDSAALFRLKARDFRALMKSIPSLNFYLSRVSSERFRKLKRISQRDFHNPVRQ
jgi:CRP-like cAMP-binding protein/ribonuclease BN (tRNA processing enzyme)